MPPALLICDPEEKVETRDAARDHPRKKGETNSSPSPLLFNSMGHEFVLSSGVERNLKAVFC